MNPTIKFKRLTDDAYLPIYAHDGDSGMDVFVTEGRYMLPHDTAKLHTGIAAVIPEGYELQVRPRSGLSARGIVAQFGTVDRGYTGEICIVLTNLSNCGYRVCEHDRVAQLVLAPVARAVIEDIADEMPTTERGSDGFGSTGYGRE